MLVSPLQESESAKCVHISPPSWASLHPPHLTRLGHLRALSWAPVLYSSFPLAIYFTHGSVYMSILISQFIPPSPYPTVSTCPFSMSTSLFLLCKEVRLYQFSRFHIYIKKPHRIFGYLHKITQRASARNGSRNAFRLFSPVLDMRCARGWPCLEFQQQETSRQEPGAAIALLIRWQRSLNLWIQDRQSLVSS